MKKNLFKAVFFILLLLVFDRIGYKIVTHIFTKVETGNKSGGIINKVLNEKAEIVIIGSSRAKHHYNIVELKKYFKSTMFNAGCDGQRLPYIRGISDLLLKKYTPRLLIIDMDERNISKAVRKDSINRATIMSPFIHDSDVIKNILYGRSHFEFIKYFSKSYVYNGKIGPILKHSILKVETNSGFVPLFGRVAKANGINEIESANNDIWYEDTYLKKLLSDLILD